MKLYKVQLNDLINGCIMIYRSILRFILIFLSLTCVVKSHCNENEVLNENVIICGVCKNIENAALNTIVNVERLGARFNDYVVILYENNSTDRTVEILMNWANENHHIIFITEMLSDEELLSFSSARAWNNAPCRMELIARARNIVLEEALDKQYDDYPYLIMADLDFMCDWPIDEIIRSIKIDSPWDVIFANGVGRSCNVWDRFALRNSQYPLGSELLGNLWWEQLGNSPLKMPQSLGLVPVYSAFGGLGIYKRECIGNARYSGLVTPELERLYRYIFSQCSLDNPQLQDYLNFIGIPHTDSDEIPVIWIKSSGYDMPVCCEHLPFHASIFNNGFRNFYINAKMAMRYNFFCE